MHTWSGTYTFTAPRHEEPRTVAELQDVVRRHDRVRALGTRHSFNALADTDGVLVSTTAIPADIEIDETRREATVGAGTRYAELAEHLQRHGWALHNMGSLPHISVGGAIATGTHGSGDLNGSLSTAVRGLTLVDPEGRLRRVRPGEEEFAGSVVALGRLGVVARVTLAVEPSYLIRQDVYRGLGWSELLADPAQVTGAGYSVSVFTDWAGEQVGRVWVKRRVESADTPVEETLLGARRDPERTQAVVEADDNTTQHGVAGAWSDRLPHFRSDRVPSSGDEIQTEYFVARDEAAPALEAVRALADRLAPHLIVSELRTVAADDLWLSPAYRRESLGIHFTWRNHPDAVDGLTRLVETGLAPFRPRPHWGKVHYVDPDHLEAAYPRLPDFRALTRDHDSDATFGGGYVDRLLGLTGR